MEIFSVPSLTSLRARCNFHGVRVALLFLLPRIINLPFFQKSLFFDSPPPLIHVFSCVCLICLVRVISWNRFAVVFHILFYTFVDQKSRPKIRTKGFNWSWDRYLIPRSQNSGKRCLLLDLFLYYRNKHPHRQEIIFSCFPKKISKNIITFETTILPSRP